MSRQKIAPSILSADFSKIGDEIKRLEEAGSDMLHCDVMDGIFVPNITFGPKMIKDIRKVSSLPLDVHLMITEPERYAQSFIDAGADILTIHIESTKKPLEALEMIKAREIKCGIAISPDTSLSLLKPLLFMADIVVLMSVYPGFGGQKFLNGALERLKELNRLRTAYNPELLIEIDGGVNTKNIKDIIEIGADIIVAGNAVVADPNPKEIIKILRNA